MASFRPYCVPATTHYALHKPLFAHFLKKVLGQNVLIFVCNPKFKHPLSFYIFSQLVFELK
jgi:hypothetical protein